MTETRARFRSLADASAADWAIIESSANVAAERAALPHALIRLLASQADTPSFGWPINAYQHCLQTATRALRDGADAETIVCALFHDATEAIDLTDHAESAARLLGSYVSAENEWMLRNHAEFQDRHITTHPTRGGEGYRRFEGHPAYARTLHFTTEWDQTSFDPDYPTEPLETFIPIVLRHFATRQERSGH